MTLQPLITETLVQAALLATLVATATQAIRRWVPTIDGARTVAVVAALTAAVAYLFLAPATAADWLAAGRVALCACAIALGGDALISKAAVKAAGKEP